jgi:hypothetical protein
MSSDESSVSKGRSYAEIGEYWDTHDLDDVWDQTESVELELDIRSSTTYFSVEGSVACRRRLC